MESFAKYIICFPKASIVVFCLRRIWHKDSSLRISPTSFWLWSSTPLITVDHEWFLVSSCTSPPSFLPNAQRCQGLLCLLRVLGDISLGMKTVLRRVPFSTLCCQGVFLSKSWAILKGGEWRSPEEKEKIQSPKEKLMIKKWISFFSVQNVSWKSGLCLEVLCLHSTCCISRSISSLIPWAPLIHQMGF